MARHTVVHLMHDVGLATWFGGSLMGAVGLNGAAAALTDPRARTRAATRGWSRWAPVNAAGIAAHLVGGAALLATDWPRVRTQQGLGRSTAVKTALTAASLGVTAWSGVLNRRMAAAGPVPAQGATEPGATTPPEVARTQRQLAAVQWLIPALTAGLVAAKSWHEEQQRAAQQVRGVLRGRAPARTLPVLLAGGAAVLLAARRRRATVNGSFSASSASDASPATSRSHLGTIGSSGADTGTAAPTPDYQALRDTRPGEQGRAVELGTEQGPATTAENRVDEEMGGSGT